MLKTIPTRLWSVRVLDSTGSLRLMMTLKNHIVTIIDAMIENAGDKDVPYYSRDRLAAALEWMETKEASDAWKRAGFLSADALENARQTEKA